MPWLPQFLADQLTLSQTLEHIMPTRLLQALHPRTHDSLTLQRPCCLFAVFSRQSRLELTTVMLTKILNCYFHFDLDFSVQKLICS